MPSYLVSAPGKVILFGEWAVLHGEPALATALSDRLQVEFEKINSLSEAVLFQSEESEFLWTEDCRIAPDFYQWPIKCVEEFLRPQGLDHLKGHRFRFRRNWPLSSGLGSSSAVFLCLALALRSRDNMHGTESPETQWSSLSPRLKVLQKGRGSGLDLATQIYGGSVLMESLSPSTIDLNFPDELVLVHTGQKASTEKLLQEVELHPEDSKALGDSVRDFLRSHDWPRNIARHAEVLTQMGVVPSFVKEALEDWKAQGWIESGKTTGAGGGDGLLLWVNPGQRLSLENDLKRRNWAINASTRNAPKACIEKKN